MRFLVDTNIWLEKLLAQRRAGEVDQFLATVPTRALAVTDFAVFSIAIRMCREGRAEAFRCFLDEVIAPRDITVIRLNSLDLGAAARTTSGGAVDFDDAYQYRAAEIHQLDIVSFDHDFDKLAHGRIEPLAAITLYRSNP